MEVLRFAIGDDAGEFGVSTKLAIDLGLAAHPLNARAGAQRLHFKHQRVAGNYRPSKAGFLNSGEEDELLIPIFDFAQREYRPALGHRFDHQDARHDRRAGEVSLKKRFVDADLFDADDPFARCEFDDTVNQQERITMRQKFLDSF